MPINDPPELADDDAYQAIMASNTERLQKIGSKGGQVNLDSVYHTSLLEFMIVGQDLLAEARRFHQARLADVLDEIEVLQDRQIEAIEEMQRKATLLNPPVNSNGHIPPTIPNIPPIRMANPRQPGRRNIGSD